GGRQGLGVELQRGVHDPHRLRRELLQRSQVRGREGDSTSAGERLQDGRRERGAFRGIRPAPDLVQQDERTRLGAFQNVLQHGNVGGESGEAGGNGLTL